MELPEGFGLDVGATVPNPKYAKYMDHKRQFNESTKEFNKLKRQVGREAVKEGNIRTRYDIANEKLSNIILNVNPF